MVKNPTVHAGDIGLTPGWGRFPWRRAWQPTPVFLPGESHRQRSLVGYKSMGWQKVKLVVSKALQMAEKKKRIKR